jgi:putative sigma-54 modulation protein
MSGAEDSLFRHTFLNINFEVSMSRKTKALEFANAEYDIHVTGRHVEVSEAMKQYALEKISKLERFLNRMIDVNVIMDIQKLNHRVEILLKAGNLKITSSAATTDMYASIDQAVHKLEAQVLRYKSKMQDHHVKIRQDSDMLVHVVKPEEIEEEEEIIDYSDNSQFRPPHVVKQETVALKTFSYDEAILKMEFSAEPFLVFKNENDQKLNIMYRRDDGNYGIIEPNCS